MFKGIANYIQNLLSPLLGRKNEEIISPLPDNYLLPAPALTSSYLSIIQKGFERYGNPPIASYSAQLAEIPVKYPFFQKHPYLLPALSIVETSGGKNLTYANNPFNWGKQPMPSVPYVIDRAASGIAGRFPYYQKFLKTGNFEDFANVYAPPAENADYLNKLKWALSFFK